MGAGSRSVVSGAVEDAAGHVNEVRLVGRLSGLPDGRRLPSGDEVVQFRLVVRRASEPRPKRAAGVSSAAQPALRAVVDTIDVSCWTSGTRRAAQKLGDGDTVEVVGALRRRFYRAGTAVQSRYEVVAAALRRPRV